MQQRISLVKIFLIPAAILFVLAFSIPAHAAGWVDGAGGWWYSYDDGSYQKGWLSDGGKWYYFDDNGYMVTGWKKIDGKWYYFNSSGAMKTGWVSSGNTWYYLYGDGSMRETKGWLQDGGCWYYLNEDGSMKTGWLKEDGSWYLLQGNGVMASSGWSSYGGYWYYFNGSGVMQTGTITDNGTTYDLGADGGIADPTSQKAQGYSSATNYLILVNRSSHMVYIFQGSQGNWGTIKSFSCTDGYATPNGTYSLGGHTYHFGEEKGYTCWYATQISGEILFHSVLYNPNSMSSIQDGRLGITASHGCIRLDIENAKYIYNNIPSGTKVVIYQ